LVAGSITEAGVKIVPNKIFVAGVGLLLVGLGVNGVRTGVVTGRIGTVQRDSNPAWFWFRVVLYVALGVLALCYAWVRDG
jgi:predicted membrane channel-forming protein YqfA (hemolysin III family)